MAAGRAVIVARDPSMISASPKVSQQPVEMMTCRALQHRALDDDADDADQTGAMIVTAIAEPGILQDQIIAEPRPTCDCGHGRN